MLAVCIIPTAFSVSYAKWQGGSPSVDASINAVIDHGPKFGKLDYSATSKNEFAILVWNGGTSGTSADYVVLEKQTSESMPSWAYGVNLNGIGDECVIAGKIYVQIIWRSTMLTDRLEEIKEGLIPSAEKRDDNWYVLLGGKGVYSFDRNATGTKINIYKIY